MRDIAGRSADDIRSIFPRRDRQGAAQGRTTSIVDIDVALRDIVFRRDFGLDEWGDRRPMGVCDHAIEGAAQPATNEPGAFDPALIYLTGYEEADRLDRSEDFDQRSVCYIAVDRRPDYAWRTDIFIERRVFRHVVELYASKRIDWARVSVVVAVTRDPSGAIVIPTLSRPPLRAAGDWRRQHTRARLASVETSLKSPPPLHPVLAELPVGWAAPPSRRLEWAGERQRSVR